MSRIIDEAREKIAQKMYYQHSTSGLEWEKASRLTRDKYLCDATGILSLSGTTDIECRECKGAKWIGHEGGFGADCPNCNGKGVIKHKWEMGVHLENGELPNIANREIPEPFNILRDKHKESFAAGCHAYKDAMLNEGWVKGV